MQDSGKLRPLGELRQPSKWLAVVVFAVVLAGAGLGVRMAQRTNYNATTVCMDGKNYYYPMARSLWKEGVPRDIWGKFCTHQPPLFPAVLAPALALGDRCGMGEKTVAQTVNILFACLSAAGVYVLCRRFVVWPLAMLVGIGFGLYPPFLWLCRDAYNEPLFTCLLVWGVKWLFDGEDSASTGYLAAGAVLLALATLTRAIGLPVIGILLGASVFFRRPRWRESVRLWLPGLALFLILVGSWSCIVSVRSGKVSPVTTSLNGGHVDGLIAGPEGSATVRRANVFFERHPRNWPAILQFHREAIATDPADYAVLVIRKVLLCWYATESQQGQKVLLLMNLPLVALGLAGLWVLARRWRETSTQLLALVGVLGYFWGMDCFVWSTLRYLVPVFWIVLLLGAVFVDDVVFGRRNADLRKEGSHVPQIAVRAC